MKASLWVPAGIVMLGAAFWTHSWPLYVLTSAIVTVVLTIVMQAQTGQYRRDKSEVVHWDGYTLDNLIADVQSEGGNQNLPLYLGGVGYGLLPVTDWYTARLDGRLALIVEHIERVD